MSTAEIVKDFIIKDILTDAAKSNLGNEDSSHRIGGYFGPSGRWRGNRAL